MIINWIAAKALPYLSIDDAELDELSVNFDFALSAEIMRCYIRKMQHVHRLTWLGRLG